MIEINKYKLVPGVEVSAHWGEIKGDITSQSDLIDYINEHGGSEAVWGSITGVITEQSDLTDYVSSALSGYATQEWVGEQDYITSVALSGYATEDWVTAQSYLVESDLSQYATRQWVTSRDYATETYVDEKTVQYDKTIGIGDSDIEDSVDVLKREVDEDGLTKQLVLGYKVIDEGVYDTIVLNDGHGSGELRLGRQEMSVEVDSGTGERTILKGEFHPYYEIEDGLPVTSEENEMTDLAGDLKYIPYDKDDCSRILVGLNTSENAWTGLMVNDEGQAGLYISSVETDAETQEQSLVDEFYPYLTEENLKTVNNQSLVGEGDIEIGGLTPEQEEAIAPLEDPSEGMLYTKNLNHYIGQRISESMFGSDYAGYLYNLDGDIYYMQNNSLFKWNPDNFSFDSLGYFSGDRGGEPLWMDFTGRIYCGVSKQLDFTDLEFDTVDLSAVDYVYQWGNHIHTIWCGQYGIYNLSGLTPQKFDEDTQQFVTVPVTITQGYDLSTIIYLFPYYGVWYDGHFVAVSGSNMFELTEYEDHLEVTYVDVPYFPMTISGASYVTDGFYFNIEGDLYYLRSNDQFKLVNGAWEQVDIRIQMDGYTNPFNFNYQVGKGVIYDDRYLIGFESDSNTGSYTLLNMGETEERTTWFKLYNTVVDLESSQNIGGSKTFNGNVYTSILHVDLVHPRQNTTQINLGMNTTSADEIKMTVNGECSLNGKGILTTDDMFFNMEVLPYGGKVQNVITDYSGTFSQYGDYYFLTHTGRLFYVNGGQYEFDGTQWNAVSTPLCSDWISAYNVVNTGVNTFFFGNSNTYIWDDANSVFTQITTGDTPVFNKWDFWPCDGGSIRFQDSMKLVENGGIWSWTSDSLSTYNRGMVHYIDGTVYVLAYDYNVYTYDESTKTYTNIGMYNYWTNTSFVVGGDIIYPWNGDRFYKIDLSKVGGSDPNISTEVNIPYSDYQFFYGEYGGFLYYYSDWSQFNYCYDEQYDLPEVPATNGTYTLQATMVDGEVTYEWVAAAPPL